MPPPRNLFKLRFVFSSMDEYVQIAQLSPQSKKVNIKVAVVSKTEPRQIISRSQGTEYRMAEALVGDSSGVILMTLWDDNIALINEGKCYDIQNGYVQVFKGSMRLNIGRYGTVVECGEEIVPNEENNVSDKEFPNTFRPRRNYGGDFGRRY